MTDNLKIHIRSEFICEYEDEHVFAIYIDGKFSSLLTAIL
jgi:hypothetical protein